MSTTALFNIVNNDSKSAKSSDIYVCIVGTDPSSGSYSYLDLNSSSPTFGTLVAFGSYTSGVTSMNLSGISMPIAVPAVQSARMYWAIGKDFDSGNFTAGSGPSASQINDGGADVMFDFVEFDTSTSGSYNINSTNVDMYGITYTMSLTNAAGQNVTVGLSADRGPMMGKFSTIPQTQTGNQGGNTSFYPNLMVMGSNGGHLRYLAPKAAAYGDILSGNHMPLTQYLSTYVNNQVFKPNRQFTFYDKFYPGSQNQYWGSVDSTGQNMTIYSDSGRTQQYCTINPPSNAWGNPSFPTNWHQNSAANSSMDWGFTLIGNALVPGSANGWGFNSGTDPVLMALMISICRGVAHLDNGTTDWVNSANFFKGGADHANFPIEYYAQIIHANAPGGLAYAFSYDDIYAQNPSCFFNAGTTITFNLNSLNPLIFA
jgi:hypothetical protein